MLEKIKKEIKEAEILFQNIPSIWIGLFFVSVISMNLLANKTIVNTPYLALDGGIFFGWLSFLCMDIVVIHFGFKASTTVSIIGIIINLITSIIFKIVALIPTFDDYSVLNSIFGGTWFILLSSTIAMLLSSIINNGLNCFIRLFFKKSKNDKLEYFCRSYISTLIAQFCDNFAFSSLVFMFFAPIYWDGFSWTLIQVINCSLFGSLVELICQAIFSPIGYKVSQRWKRNNIGEKYFIYKQNN